MKPVELTTQRLRLREFVEEDWEAVHEYATDPAIFRFRSSQPSASEEQTRRQLQRIRDEQQQQLRPVYFLAILLRDRDRLIGECFLRFLDAEAGTAFMGYCLNRRYWGQGCMTEAVRALIDFGFEKLGLSHISACCHPDNIGSWRVMEKCGMQWDELVRQERLNETGEQDAMAYSITRQDWLARSRSVGSCSKEDG